jgi:hypothetical protein
MSQGGSNTTKWVLIGCGSGCAVVILIVVILGVAGGFAAKKGMDKVKGGMVSGLQSSYDDLKADGQVPAEYTAQFDELVQISQQPNTSFWCVMFATGIVSDTLSDGTVDESEAPMIDAVLGFVRDNPDAGIIEFSQFVEKHPELQKTFQNMQQQQQYGSY